MTEGVGAVFGIPHVPELWEEVSRGHRSRSGSYRARSRSRSKSALEDVRKIMHIKGGEGGGVDHTSVIVY